MPVGRLAWNDPLAVRMAAGGLLLVQVRLRCHDGWGELGGDRTIEAVGGGTDSVLTSINYTLAPGQEVEFLSTISATSVIGLHLGGNDLANTIIGNAGDNQLFGGDGRRDEVRPRRISERASFCRDARSGHNRPPIRRDHR